MYKAIPKQATTIVTQAILAARDLAVEMCTRPWIVELSKNSQIALDAILGSRIPVLGVFSEFQSCVEYHECPS